jgi:hypothetical protein
VGNLTTASNSARGFTTLLLGLHFAERVAAGADDKESARLHAFLKFEQLAGYARVVCNGDESIRGITQIKRRLDDNSRSVTIGASQGFQILSNQKTYGLWGLFMMPAIACGLVVSKDLSLTPVAREFVENEHLRVLRINGRDQGLIVERLLSKERFDVEPQKKDKPLFDALGKVLSPKFHQREYDFYHYHLILGGEEGEKAGWQPRFATLLERDLRRDKDFDHFDLLALIDASRQGSDDELCGHLLKILHLESLIVAMGNLFGFLQHRDNSTIASIVKELEKAWLGGLQHLPSNSIAELQPDLSIVLGDSDVAARLVALARAIETGEFEAAIDLVLAHNKFVMNSRNNSQAWIQRVGNKIDVRYRDSTEQRLLDPDELAVEWRSTFYINPLKTVSDQLRRRA